VAEVPYNGGVATVSPDASAPNDYIKVNATPESFGAAIGRGLEKAGSGLEATSQNLFKLNDFYDKVAVDDQINKLIDNSNEIRRGDPGKTVAGPDGQPQPDVGYLGTTGRTALDNREPTMKALDDAIESGKKNLTSDQQRLAFETQSRRMRAQWTDQIGAHSGTQFKTWAASVNSAAATHAINHIAANPEGEEFAHGAADLINARVQEVQSKYGDDPQLKTEAIAKAKQEALKTQLATIGARDPSRALEILEKNRGIAGADYAPMVEHLRGRADQQDGISAADKMINERSSRPYGNAAHPVYAAAASESPGGMSPQGLARTVQIESSGNPNSANASDHVGLGQFSASTATEVGITNRNDPEQSVRGIARYAQKNAPMLTKALGRAPDDAEFYLAHQQGPGGAAKLFANPNTRAGDLVGDKAISQNGGDPNAPASAFTDLWKAKFNKAAVATGEASPAESLAHREGELKLAVLNDPAMTDRPQMQAAALNRINVTFAAQRETQTNDAATFKLKLQNSTAEALDTGAVKTPLAPDEFTAALGQTEGQRQYAEYQANVQLGADMRATASMGPEQLSRMQQHYQPEPGSDNYVAQGKRAEQLSKAIAQNEALKAKDPAAFLVSRTDVGNESWRRFATIMADPKASSDQKKVAAGLFADTMKSEQARVGVTPDAVKLVPDWYVGRLVDRLHAANADGTASPIGPQLEAEAKIWGDNWPSITRQIPKEAGPLVRVLSSGVPSAAAQKLQQVENISLHNNLKDQDDARASQIKKDVLDAFKPFASSLAGNAGNLSLFNDFRGQAEKLAAMYIIGGKTSSDAATQAFNDLVGAKYSFQDGYRVPKDAGVAPDIIAQGTVAAMSQLGKTQAFDSVKAPGLVELGNIDLARRPVVKNADGSVSTVRSLGVNVDGREVLIPTVSDDGRIMTDKEAVETYRQTGKHLGKFDTPENSTAYAEKLHESQAQRYASPLSIKPAADTIGGLSPDYLVEGKVKSLQRDGKWVTSPDEKGLMLVHNDQAVRRPDGSPLILSWKQLNDLAQPVIQKRDQEFNAHFRLGTFG
jgi:hypothetical protein